MNIDDVKRLNRLISGNVASGGILRQSLEMYDECKQVDAQVKTETFMFTTGVMALCTRSELLFQLDARKHCES